MFDTGHMDVHLDHQIEQLRRSVAMLPPGHQALDRETALKVLARLQVVSTRVGRLEHGLRQLLEEPTVPESRGAAGSASRHPSTWDPN